MLHVCGGGPPVVFHDTFDSAAKEAERLALKENKSVAVLQSVALCVPPQTTAVSWEFADNVTIAQKDEADDALAVKFDELLSRLFPTR